MVPYDPKWSKNGNFSVYVFPKFDEQFIHFGWKIERVTFSFSILVVLLWLQPLAHSALWPGEQWLLLNMSTIPAEHFQFSNIAPHFTSMNSELQTEYHHCADINVYLTWCKMFKLRNQNNQMQRRPSGFLHKFICSAFVILPVVGE